MTNLTAYGGQRHRYLLWNLEIPYHKLVKSI